MCLPRSFFRYSWKVKDPSDIPYLLAQAWGKEYFPNSYTSINKSKKCQLSSPILVSEYFEYFAN